MNGQPTCQVWDPSPRGAPTSQLTSFRVQIFSTRTCLKLVVLATLSFRKGIIVGIRRWTSKTPTAKFWFNAWLIMEKDMFSFKLNNRFTALKNTFKQKHWKNHKLLNYMRKNLTYRWLITTIKDWKQSVTILTSTKGLTRDRKSESVQVLARLTTLRKILLSWSRL